MTDKLIIAIDGPSGAGKSTICKLLAAKTGYMLVDTGAIYRSLAYIGINSGIDLNNENALVLLSKDLNIDFEMDGNINRVFVDNKEITDKIRTPEISMAASKVSAYPGVRNALLGLQRKMGEKGGVVLEGRDIGTVVFPYAHLKFFLTASNKVRAERRYKELVEKGEKVVFEEVLSDIEKRDFDDSTRKAAPLKKAEDAIEVDCSNLSLDQVIELLLNYFN